jgi:uncharacterized protein (DUF2164 family)
VPPRIRTYSDCVAKTGTKSSRIRLSDDRRQQLLAALKRYFDAEFDEPLSDFRAEGLLDFFVGALGPPIYNQGVRDTASYIQAKLADIEGDVYEPELSS